MNGLVRCLTAAMLAYMLVFFSSVALGQETLNETRKALVPGSASKLIEHVTYKNLMYMVPRDFDAVMPFTIGEPYKQNMGPAIEKAIVEYAMKRGYYRAKAKADFIETAEGSITVEITVDEGAPCTIRNFTIDEPIGFKSQHQFQSFRQKEYAAAGIEPGQRYDEERISERFRELHEWLVSQDYVLSNTDKISLSFSDDYTQVDVTANVVYGERISFGFQGNTVFSRGELNDMITQIRTSGLGRDFMATIRDRFIEEYKSKAYTSVEIVSKTVDNDGLKHTTFQIKEGIRTKLNDIRFEGLSQDNLAAAQKTFNDNVSRLVQRGYFVEKDIDKGIDLVIENLRSRGYLSTKLVAKTVAPEKSLDRTANHVTVVVQITEGEQTIVGRLEINGATVFSQQEIVDILGLKENQPFNPFALEEGLQKLQFKYVSAGYLDYRLASRENEIVAFTGNNRFANVRVDVYEGRRIRVDEVHIEGLVKTRQYVVDREIAIASGDWWTADKIQETEANLRKLNLFSDIKLRRELSQKGPEWRNLVVDLKEGEPGAFEIGPGFRSDLGLRAFTKLSYNNFWGKNWIGSVGVEANRRLYEQSLSNTNYGINKSQNDKRQTEQKRFIEYKTDATLIEPRLFGSRFLYSVGASTSLQQFPPDFNAQTKRFSTGIEHKFWNDLVTAKMYYKIENIRQFDVYINGVYSELDNQTLLIGSLNPSLSYDTRDSPFTTTKGQITSLSLEYAAPEFSGKTAQDSNSTGYYKWTASSHWYLPVTKDIVWSNVAAGGFERSNIEGRAIPLIKLFRLGGYSSIRGFTEDSLNVDTIAILGTLTFLNFRSQFDLPFIGDLKFAPFIDAGNLYVDSLHGNPFLRAGAGAGLHYVTPIGPINLDYGVKLNPLHNEDTSQIHFSVGLI